MDKLEQREGPGRRAEMVVPPNDTRSPRVFVEQLMQARVRDAWLLGPSAEASAFLAGAAEASEFALADEERALVLFGQSAEHPEPDPRAFAGLRRSARLEGDADALLARYEEELERASDPAQRVWAGVGAARTALRMGAEADEVLGLLDALREEAASLPTELLALLDLTREAALAAGGRVEDAHRSRSRRWGVLADVLGEEGESYAAPGALAIAVAAEAAGLEPDVALDWYGVSLEADASPDAVWPLLRESLDRGDAAAAEALLADAVSRVAAPAERGRLQLLLGQLRAWRLDDRSGALQAWSEAIRGSEVAPLAAAGFLAVARQSHGAVDGQGFLDALGARLELAATAVERADLLTWMAARMLAEDALAPAALDLAREALREDPGHDAAFRLIDDLLRREGQSAERALLLEQRLEALDAPEARAAVHDTLAALYSRELQQPAEAERHLRALLDLRPSRAAVRELAGLLVAAHRWDEAIDHLVTAAERMGSPRERGAWLSRAVELARHALKDVDLAIELSAMLLERVPEHGHAVAGLAQLLEGQGRWEELLALLDAELARFESDPQARAAVACWGARIARDHRGDVSEAEAWWRRALREDGGHGEALEGLADMLHTQQRWEELATIHEQQLRVATSDRARARALRRLGELYATRLADLQRARECFMRLLACSPRDGELSLIWLERIHEARGERDDLLRILRLRLEAAEGTEGYGRLAFRIAMHLEFVDREEGEAFDAYVASLADELCAPAAVDALDRLWPSDGVDEDSRVRGADALQTLASTNATVRHRALRVLAERAAETIGAVRAGEVWHAIADEWPADVVAGERCAQLALAQGHVAAAESYRSTIAIGAVEAFAVSWDALDQSMPAPQEWDGVGLQPLRAWLARESGRSDVAFPGADERELHERIRVGSVTVGELLHGAESDADRRLAVAAARALGRTEDLVASWLQHVDALHAPVLRLQALLDLADDSAVPAEERRKRLAEACGLGLHEHALRGDLYDRLETEGELVVLARALGEHLDVVSELDDATRSGLTLRRARALTQSGAREDALQALRGAVVRIPGDPRLSLEKARLETELDRLDDARETLESCLDAGLQGSERIAVLGRLAELHERRGGDIRRAISCLEDACTLSDDAPAQALRLAHVHARGGSAQRAADLLASALELPPAEDALHHWLLLARLQGHRLHQVDEAEDLLWTLFRQFPEREEVLGGLEDFYRHVDNAAGFAHRLAGLLLTGELSATAARISDLWLYVGEVNAAVLQDWRAAEEAFGHARRGRPTCGDVRLREARAIVRQADRGRDASRRILEMLELSEVDADQWEKGLTVLDEAYTALEDGARRRVVRQARAALAGGVLSGEEARRVRAPSRSVEVPLTWHLLARDLLEQGALPVLRALTPLVERVCGDRIPDRRAYDAVRLRPEDHPAFSDALDVASHWLQVSPAKLWHSGQVHGWTAVDGGGLVLASHALESDDPRVLRFHAGGLVAAALTGAGSLLHVGDAVIRDALRAVAWRALDIESCADAALGDAIAGLLLTPQRRAAGNALREHADVLERSDGWCEGIVAFADRAGLVCAGDVSVAVAEIRRSAPGREAERRVTSLLRFALSDAHEEARFEAGLTRRPLGLESGGASNLSGGLRTIG